MFVEIKNNTLFYSKKTSHIFNECTITHGPILKLNNFDIDSIFKGIINLEMVYGSSIMAFL